MLETDLRMYKRLRNKTTTYLRKASKLFILNSYFKQLDQTKGNPKVFWNIMRKVLPSKSSIREIEKVTIDEQDITIAKQIANSFNTYFTSDAARVLPNASVDIDAIEPRQTSNHPSFRFHPVHKTEILNHLELLKPGKATKHDNIASTSIKTAQSSIYQNLSEIINCLLQDRIFPTEWKIAKISLVFKCNPPNDLDNYRPISILTCLSKVCESIVHNQFNDYSRCNQNIIENKNQFACTKHYSTATALLKVVFTRTKNQMQTRNEK